MTPSYSRSPFLVQLVCALIVLATSAAVVSDFSTWSACTTSATSTTQYCTIAADSPQGYINIALFTSIIGLLFVGTLAVGEYVVRGQHGASGLPRQSTPARSPSSRAASTPTRATAFSTNHMDHKVLFGASLVFFPLLWIFWFTSLITTTLLCSQTGSKWDTLNAACAFTWFSWFAVSGSCYIVGRDVWDGRTGRDGAKGAIGTSGSGREQLESTTSVGGKSRSHMSANETSVENGMSPSASVESGLSRREGGGEPRKKSSSSSRSKGDGTRGHAHSHSRSRSRSDGRREDRSREAAGKPRSDTVAEAV